jgi:hypothetical protein
MKNETHCYYFQDWFNHENDSEALIEVVDNLIFECYFLSISVVIDWETDHIQDDTKGDEILEPPK